MSLNKIKHKLTTCLENLLKNQNGWCDLGLYDESHVQRLMDSGMSKEEARSHIYEEDRKDTMHVFKFLGYSSAICLLTLSLAVLNNYKTEYSQEKILKDAHTAEKLAYKGYKDRCFYILGDHENDGIIKLSM